MFAHIHCRLNALCAACTVHYRRAQGFFFFVAAVVVKGREESRVVIIMGFLSFVVR